MSLIPKNRDAEHEQERGRRKTLNMPCNTNVGTWNKGAVRKQNKNQMWKHTHAPHAHAEKKVDAKRDCHDGKSGFSVHNRCINSFSLSIHLFGLFTVFVSIHIYFYGSSISHVVCCFCFLNFARYAFVRSNQIHVIFGGSTTTVNWYGSIIHLDDDQKRSIEVSA